MASSKKNKSNASRMKQGNLYSFFAPKKASTPSATKAVNAGKASQKSPDAASLVRHSSSSTSNSTALKSEKWKMVKLNMKIAVFWPDDRQYYPAAVKKESNDRTRWLLEYDDGDTEWVNLKTEKFRFIDDDEVEDEVPKQDTKKRRRIEEEDEEEFEFVGGDEEEEDDDDEMEYIEEKEESDNQWLSDTDNEETLQSKKTKKASNKRPKVTEHKISSSSPPASMASDSCSISRGATPTPKSLASFSAFSASKTPGSPNRVTPPSSLRKSTTSIAVDDPENWNGEKALPYVRDVVNPLGAHLHNHLEFLRNPKDANGRIPGEPGYSARTLRVDTNELRRHYNSANNKTKALSPGVQQWWDMKAQYFDTILLFKTGKFYEVFQSDADIAVRVLGLQYMKGHVAHCGFPEISYGKLADKLVRAGYKVARIEQTETPDQLKIRKKNTPKGSATPKVVNREVCSIMTMGTRTYCYLDVEMEDFSMEPSGAGPLLAIKEVLVESAEHEQEGDALIPTCEYGISIVDASRAAITIGQFADDALRSRMMTLLTTFNPSEILVEGGENGASPGLRALLKSAQTSSPTKFRVEDVSPNEVFPRSTAVDPSVRQKLDRKNGRVQPWNVQETLEEIHGRNYFPRATRKQKDLRSSSRWPQVLRSAVEGNAELALSSLGAALYYLQRNLIDHEILSMGLVRAYVPPASPVDRSENGLSQASEDASETSGLDKLSPAIVGTRGDGNEDEDSITHMSIDGNTLVQLDILVNSSDNKSPGSLVHLIDSTKSPGGSRVLRAWLLRPLFQKLQIQRRADAVEQLMSGEVAMAMSEASNLLSKCGDIERLLATVHSMSGPGISDEVEVDTSHPNNRAVLYEMKKYQKRKVGDFSKLLSGLRSASRIPEVFEGIPIRKSGLLQKLVRTVSNGGGFPEISNELDFFEDNIDLEKAADGEFEPSRGVDPAFDNACDEIDRVKAELERYKDEMCSKVLKGNSRNVWKYTNTSQDSKDKYTIELPKAIRVSTEFNMVGKRGSGAKQICKYRTQTVETLVKAYETAVDVHKERKARQLQLIFANFDSKRNLWNAVGIAAATLDALSSLAELGKKPGYCRPEILDCTAEAKPTIKIVQGRHPCVERTPCSGDFIPNDLNLGQGENSPTVLLLSGPNMGGKSTLLRQTCLICILAQIGAFVPAAQCALTPIDVLMTRLGASDRILMGQSTFFVELAETAAALRGATRRSLLVQDELGRGTSSFDGTAIASACLSFICTNLKCLSLFATHYHSLLDERKTDPNVRLAHMESFVNDDEEDGKESITFLYTLGEGACPKSFGINVARLARLPEEVLRKAERISSDFEMEMNGASRHTKIAPSEAAKQKRQLVKLVNDGIVNMEDIDTMWESLQANS